MDIDNNTLIFKKFFSNPWVGIIGSVSSLVGLLLAVIFYFNAIKEPELVYSFHPLKNTLIQSGITSDLSIFHKGVEIKGESVIAVTFSIWNQGSESIRAESILEEIKIESNPKVKILNASLSKITRELTRFSIINNKEQWDSGVIPLTWGILENGDGVSIQIVYSGDIDSEFTLGGVIETQGSPISAGGYPLSNVKNTTVESPLSFNQTRWFLVFSIVFFSSLTVLSSFIRRYGTTKQKTLHKIFMPKVFRGSSFKESISILFLMSAIAALLFYILGRWIPPFGI
jgi:hypothetical protein